MNAKLILNVLLMLTLCLGFPVLAADDAPPESVTFKGGKVLVPKDGKPVETTKDVVFAGEIVIKTNGVYTVQKGKPRQLREGQSIDAQGMLTSPDGSVVPVFDHLTVKGGRVLVVKDGESRPLTGELAMSDGSKITADGTRRGRDGRLQRLLDGQLLKLDGGAVGVTDTVSMKDGKVILFKDGGRLELRRGQIITMSDGSRVGGDGTVVRPGGAKLALKEGEMLKLPGVLSGGR